MNCETCQRRLLASADPEDPAAAVRAHLAECSACRRRQRQLLRLERHVPLLPVPPGQGKNRLLNKLLILDAPAPAPPPPSQTIPMPARPWWRGPRVRRLGGAAAAAVLIGCGVLLGLAQLRRDQTADLPRVNVAEPEPDLVARLVECDARLAAAEASHKQVEELAEMADALRREGQALRRADAGAAEMGEVARLYAKVIREGVVARARALPTAERRQVLHPIATRLARAAQEARQLANGHAAPAPLLQIAQAARDGDRQLRELMEVTQ